MKFVLRRVAEKGETQPEGRDPTKYVRKSWVISVAYYAATSLAVGLGLAVMMFGFAVLGVSKRGNRRPMSVHDASIFSVAILVVVTGITFFIQLISGPFVFTKDVVCKKCGRRRRVERIAFFSGKYRRPPKCECGGTIEPAFLWKPESNPKKCSS